MLPWFYLHSAQFGQSHKLRHGRPAAPTSAIPGGDSICGGDPKCELHNSKKHLSAKIFGFPQQISLSAPSGPFHYHLLPFDHFCFLIKLSLLFRSSHDYYRSSHFSGLYFGAGIRYELLPWANRLCPSHPSHLQWNHPLFQLSQWEESPNAWMENRWIFLLDLNPCEGKKTKSVHSRGRGR